MDGVSLGLGVAGFVLQAHHAVVGCIEAMRNFREVGDKNATLNCMLFIEQYRLMHWGRCCQLSEGNLGAHLTTPESQAVALMILRKMLEVVAETEKLRLRYGVNYLSMSKDEPSLETQKTFGMWANIQTISPITHFTPAIEKQAPEAGLMMSALGSAEEAILYSKSIEKGNSSMKFMRKCRWVVSDSKRFEGMIKQLREFNHSLERLVSQKSQTQQVMRLETEILQNTPEGDLYVLEQATIESHPTLSNAASTRARVSRLEPEELAIDSTSTRTPFRNLHITLDQLDFRPIPKSASKMRAMALYQPKLGAEYPVLVEWRKFDSGLTQFTRDATIKRATSLAQIMSPSAHQDPANTFRKLNCAGYFVNDDRVGYIFEIPRSAKPNSHPKSLLSLLYEEGVLESERVDIDKPPLEERFALSKALCKCIYYLHASELVHKGIRSDNVLFFRQEGDREERIRLEEPFVTGFDHSRPDGPDDPTITKASLSDDEDRYRHPEFHTSSSRKSTKVHDLYSLGLVLLEISHWAKLKSLVGDLKGEAIVSFIRAEGGPIDELDHLMGSRYREVVERCIQSRFDVRTEDKGALQRVFLDEIIGEIMKCSV